MTNAVLSWINRLATAVLSTDSEVATLPLAEIVSPHLSDKWQTDGATSAYLAADFGAVVAIGVVGLFGTNLSASATWRIRLSAIAPGGGELLDTGVVSMGVVAGYGQAVHVLSSAVNARYLRIDLDDPDSTAGFLQVGAAWAGPLWQPARNFAYGAAAGWRDDSVVSRSKGGQAYVDLRPRYRVAEVEFRFLTEAEAFEGAFEIDRLVGLAGNLLLVPDPGGPWQNRQALLGRLVDATEVQNAALKVFAKRYRLEERR